MQGHFELNVYKPLMAANVINSLYLLSSSIERFDKEVVAQLVPNTERIKELMENSLMIVTALNPYIGYENSAKIAKYAQKNDTTLKEAGEKLGLVKPEEYDQWVDTKKMAYPY